MSSELPRGDTAHDDPSPLVMTELTAAQHEEAMRRYVVLPPHFHRRRSTRPHHPNPARTSPRSRPDPADRRTRTAEESAVHRLHHPDRQHSRNGAEPTARLVRRGPRHHHRDGSRSPDPHPRRRERTTRQVRAGLPQTKPNPEPDLAGRSHRTRHRNSRPRRCSCAAMADRDPRRLLPRRPRLHRRSRRTQRSGRWRSISRSFERTWSRN